MIPAPPTSPQCHPAGPQCHPAGSPQHWNIMRLKFRHDPSATHKPPVPPCRPPVPPCRTPQHWNITRFKFRHAPSATPQAPSATLQGIYRTITWPSSSAHSSQYNTLQIQHTSNTTQFKYNAAKRNYSCSRILSFTIRLLLILSSINSGTSDDH